MCLFTVSNEKLSENIWKMNGQVHSRGNIFLIFGIVIWDKVFFNAEFDLFIALH